MVSPGHLDDVITQLSKSGMKVRIKVHNVQTSVQVFCGLSGLARCHYV